jgi:hypothetical protein
VSTAAASATIDIVAGRHVQQGGTTQSVTLSSANGDIAIRAGATGNIVLETVNAGTADVLLQAGGSVTDGDAADSTSSEVDVIAAGLLLNAGAAGGIGSGSNGLEVTVDRLSAVAGTGGLFIRETNALTLDAVTVAVQRIAASAALPAQTTDLSQSVNTTGAGGQLVVQAGGSLTVSQTVTAGGAGNLLLQAGGSGSLVATADITSGSGHISLLAADTITLNAGVDVTTAANGSLDIAAQTLSLIHI